MQSTQTAQPPFAATGCAADSCGAAASCYRCSWFICRRRRSRFTHMSHASQLPFVVAGGAAVACGAAALWFRRRRRSRLTHPPQTAQLPFTSADGAADADGATSQVGSRSKLRSCLILLLVAQPPQTAQSLSVAVVFKTATLLRARAVVHWSLWTTAGACL